MSTPESSPLQPRFSIRVSVARQQLDLIENGQPTVTYPVSTSKFGLGFEPGSYRTPTGRFVVDQMIGKDAPLNAIFKARQFTGEIAQPGGDHDHVLTRILWLAGQDSANANTRDRFIYIHGTNQENLIGSPASHGCVRMRNADVADLFNRVTPGTPVEITT